VGQYNEASQFTRRNWPPSRRTARSRTGLKSVKAWIPICTRWRTSPAQWAKCQVVSNTRKPGDAIRTWDSRRTIITLYTMPFRKMLG